MYVQLIYYRHPNLLVSNSETPSGAPLCEAYPLTSRPHRRPTKGNSKKSPLCRVYKRIRPSVPHNCITLCPTPSHWEVRLPSGIFHKHLLRPSMVQYVLLCKYLLTTPPMILVPDKLGMRPSGTRPSSTRQDTHPSNQPFP